MFCPRCATQNSDNVKYCRACRENLKVIAQAMTRHLPVVLAGKLDEFFERKSERFRRDSIVAYLIGVSFLFLAVFDAVFSTGERWFTVSVAFLAAGIFLVEGTWHMLVYRRSLALSPRPTKLTSPAKMMYCPRCAQSNGGGARFCQRCGENLKGIERAMSGRWPAWLAKRLDRAIDRSNINIRSNSKTMAIVGVTYVFIALVEEEWIKFGVFLFIACLFFLVSLWELVVHRRRSTAAPSQSALHPATHTAQIMPPGDLPVAPPSVTEATTRPLDPIAERLNEKL